MTPGARLAAAIEVCGLIWTSTAPPEAVVRHYFRGRRYAGGGDRRAVFALVFDLLRRRARLDWWIGCAGLEPDDRRRALANLLLDGTAADAAAALFGEGVHTPGAFDADDTALAAQLAGQPLDDPGMPPAVRLECPPWLYPDLLALWGDRAEAELAALNRPAPLDLRVNVARAGRDAVARRLGEEGLIAQPTPYSPWGLRLPPGSRLEQTAVLADGSAEIQDEGSQVVAALVDARPGLAVVDLCAGAGGKTLALGALMVEDGRLRGRLVAADTERSRLAPLADRLTSAGLSGVETATLAEDGPLAALAGAADRVLVDAPCTGSGTWRRRPDLRWRQGPDSLSRHATLQDAILDRAAGLLRPGGRLVYATCALARQENEDRVARLLAMRPELLVVPVGDVWTGATPLPAAAAPFVRLSPATSGTDGFFCAVLARAN